jgi:hypothetical protein
MGKTMFESNDVLSVGEFEGWSAADSFGNALLALGVARLNTALQLARAGAVPSDIEAFG